MKYVWDSLEEAEAELVGVAESDYLGDDVVHDGNGGYAVVIVVGTQHDKVHGLDADAIMLLKHVAVEVLLEAVMVVGGVGNGDTACGGAPAEGLGDGTSGGVNDLAAALPVVDSELAVIVATDEVDGASKVQVGIEDGPLLTVGTDGVIVDEMEEMLPFALDIDIFDGAVIVEGAEGVETALLKIVLGLFVYESAHLARHAADALPFGEGLGNGDAVAILLLLSGPLGVESFEEMGDKGADRQQAALASVEVDMAFGQEVDVVVLRI